MRNNYKKHSIKLKSMTKNHKNFNKIIESEQIMHMKNLNYCYNKKNIYSMNNCILCIWCKYLTDFFLWNFTYIHEKLVLFLLYLINSLKNIWPSTDNWDIYVKIFKNKNFSKRRYIKTKLIVKIT